MFIQCHKKKKEIALHRYVFLIDCKSLEQYEKTSNTIQLVFLVCCIHFIAFIIFIVIIIIIQSTKNWIWQVMNFSEGYNTAAVDQFCREKVQLTVADEISTPLIVIF